MRFEGTERYGKKILKSILNVLISCGINPILLLQSFRGIPIFLRDLISFEKKVCRVAKPSFTITTLYPIFNDRFVESGIASGHYFHQDLLIARRIFFNTPTKHVDIGSRIDGFVAHVAAFREIEVFDIRPLPRRIENVTFTRIDIMRDDLDMLDYTDSLSSLHAVEHFGLGRYGDPIDPDGHIKGLNNMYKFLKAGGKFYLSLPIGKQRIEFNAHRIFSLEYILFLIGGKYRIDRFSYVDDNGDLFDHVPLAEKDIKQNYGCHYGCGIFELTKE